MYKLLGMLGFEGTRTRPFWLKKNKRSKMIRKPFKCVRIDPRSLQQIFSALDAPQGSELDLSRVCRKSGKDENGIFGSFTMH